MLRVSALLAPLLTLIRPGVRVGRRTGHAHGHSCTRRNILSAVEIHALLLPVRCQTITANLHARWRRDQQPATRINRGDFYCRGVSRIRQLVRVPHRIRPRPKRERNRIAIALFVDRHLHHRHSSRPGSGYMLKLALFRQCEIKTSFASVEGHRRLRLVLDLILFPDAHRRALRLKDHHMQRNVDRLGILGRLINIHLRRGRARRQGLVEIDPVIHRPYQHWLGANSRVVKREFPLCAALGMRDFLHSSEELYQYKFNSGRCLAGGAVHHGAVHRSCLSDCRQRSQNERGDETQARRARELHCAPPSAGRVPRGRRTCASVT